MKDDWKDDIIKGSNFVIENLESLELNLSNANEVLNESIDMHSKEITRISTLTTDIVDYTLYGLRELMKSLIEVFEVLNQNHIRLQEHILKQPSEMSDLVETIFNEFNKENGMWILSAECEASGLIQSAKFEILDLIENLRDRIKEDE